MVISLGSPALADSRPRPGPRADRDRALDDARTLPMKRLGSLLPLLVASVSLTAFAAGCGGSSKSSSSTSATVASTTSASSTPTTTSAKKTPRHSPAKSVTTTTTAQTVTANGVVYRTGQACDAKNEVTYVTVGFTCLQGHLTSSGATISGGKPPAIYQAGQFCKPGDEQLYNSYHLTCVRGVLHKQ